MRVGIPAEKGRRVAGSSKLLPAAAKTPPFAVAFEDGFEKGLFGKPVQVGGFLDTGFAPAGGSRQIAG